MRPPGRMAVLRVLAATVSLGAIAALCGDRLAGALLSLWRVELPLFLSAHWRVEHLAIDREGADRVVRLLVGLHDCVTIGPQTVCPPQPPLGNASTLVGNVTMPSVVLLAIALGWPTTLRGEWRTRSVFLLISLLLLWMADVPPTLAAAFWRVWSDATQTSPPLMLSAWAAFLQAGGRAALGVALAVGAVTAGAASARILASSVPGTPAARLLQ